MIRFKKSDKKQLLPGKVSEYFLIRNLYHDSTVDRPTAISALCLDMGQFMLEIAAPNIIKYRNSTTANNTVLIHKDRSMLTSGCILRGCRDCGDCGLESFKFQTGGKGSGKRAHKIPPPLIYRTQGPVFGLC